jgi:hypothetical protein
MGIAIICAVVTKGSTSVHFHALGPVDNRNQRDVDALAAFDALAPPALTDDRHTRYRAAGDFPAYLSGTGHASEPNLRPSVLGSWLYTPAAPDDADLLELRIEDASWTLRSESASR